MIWGLYDTVENCWMGTLQAPLTYDNEFSGDAESIAKVAAQTLNCQLRWEPGRIRAKEFDPLANKRRDEELIPSLSAEEALRRLEEGTEIG